MKTYNLFISHSWAYSDAYEKLVNLLDKRPYFPIATTLFPKMIRYTPTEQIDNSIMP